LVDRPSERWIGRSIDRAIERFIARSSKRSSELSSRRWPPAEIRRCKT
jgi:hypothetical protein